MSKPPSTVRSYKSLEMAESQAASPSMVFHGVPESKTSWELSRANAMGTEKGETEDSGGERRAKERERQRLKSGRGRRHAAGMLQACGPRTQMRFFRYTV
jgi:hypothetical protein